MIGRTSRRDIDKEIYSASVVERATCDCSLDVQIMGHPAQKIIQPLLDFAVLGSSAALSMFQLPEKSASQLHSNPFIAFGEKRI